MMNVIKRIPVALVFCLWAGPAVAFDLLDGMSDILWHHGSTAENHVWRMFHATYAASNSIPNSGNTGWLPVATADFNRDTYTDIFWLLSNGDTSIWLMEGGELLCTNGCTFLSKQPT